MQSPASDANERRSRRRAELRGQNNAKKKRTIALDNEAGRLSGMYLDGKAKQQYQAVSTNQPPRVSVRLLRRTEGERPAADGNWKRR